MSFIFIWFPEGSRRGSRRGGPGCAYPPVLCWFYVSPQYIHGNLESIYDPVWTISRSKPIARRGVNNFPQEGHFCLAKKKEGCKKKNSSWLGTHGRSRRRILSNVSVQDQPTGLLQHTSVTTKLEITCNITSFFHVFVTPGTSVKRLMIDVWQEVWITYLTLDDQHILSEWLILWIPLAPSWLFCMHWVTHCIHRQPKLGGGLGSSMRFLPSRYLKSWVSVRNSKLKRSTCHCCLLCPLWSPRSWWGRGANFTSVLFSRYWENNTDVKFAPRPHRPSHSLNTEGNHRRQQWQVDFVYFEFLTETRDLSRRQKSPYQCQN